MRHLCQNLVLSVAVLLASSQTAISGEVILFRKGETPDPQDIARMLKGTANSAEPGIAPRPRTRGIKLMSDEPPAAKAQAREDERVAQTQQAQSQAQSPDQTTIVQTQPASADSSGPVTFALQIQFGNSSAELQPEMLEVLDAVAEGIKLAGNLKIVVEGHTDSIGAVDFNLLLSKRRAMAVKNYLISKHNIPADNLRIIGKGKFEPLVKDNPAAPENRRVQFRTEG